MAHAWRGSEDVEGAGEGDGEGDGDGGEGVEEDAEDEEATTDATTVADVPAVPFTPATAPQRTGSGSVQ